MTFVSAVFTFDLVVLAVILLSIPCVLIALAYRKPSHD